ncbi:uncharacterized protein LOC134095983 [Sardina pilchardus]|uniref:uncharacterized protein LOC134095983 n=1 Tax=Sardina pilchardus TaxID=27697 RepID=UPI002E150873
MCVLLPQMRAFTGLVVLLVTSAYGLDSMCDATQDATCYGALGGPVYLQLMRNARGRELRLYYGSAAAFRFRKSKSVFSYEFNTPSVLQRWQFVPDNGTMIINPAERRDAGTYRVEIYESSGKLVGVHTVELTIEAPVSDVDLSITCSAYGEMRAMCSSNGDRPQYSWFLDGRPLNETSTNQCTEKQKDSPPISTPSGSAGSCTDLLEGTQGNLTCSARNNISSTSKTQPLPSCTTTTSPTPPKTTTPPDPTSISTAAKTTNNGGVSPVFISVWLAEIIILTSLLGGYYLYIRNRTTHTAGERKDQEG